jgi:hypothetical protein
MSYGKKLNELERQVDRFGVDDDFYRELCTLASKISEKFPIGNDEIKQRFQERDFVRLMNVCRSHLEKYIHIINNDDTTSSYSHHSS